MVFLNIVVILIVFKMAPSAEEDCKRYFTSYDVSVETEESQKEMNLEQEILNSQCTEYCEKDPKVRYFMCW